ncbi:MAG: hypothetical protein H0T73_20105 [Ardenticatenales bacterium]|nr:hypothetical protein [Ardenticatenales bacterium]
MGFDLPLYYIVGVVPVKFLRTQDGRMVVLKMDKRGHWVYGNDMLYSALFGTSDVEEVSEAEFIQHVEKMRGQRLTREGSVYDLYAVIQAMEEVAQEEGRRLTPQEQTILHELRCHTHELFEASLPPFPEEEDDIVSADPPADTS